MTDPDSTTNADATPPKPENRKTGAYFGIAAGLGVLTNGLVAWTQGDTLQRREAGKNRALTGALWLVPSMVLARYGNQPMEKQLDQLEHKLAAHLHQEGVSLDAGHLKMASDEEHRNLGQKLERFLTNYPIEVNYAIIALASAGILRSGLIRRKIGEGEAGIGNIAISALSVAAAFAAILIPEKTDEQIAEHGQTGTLWGKIQKQPLAYANIAMLAGDLTEGVNAHGEFKAAKALPASNPFKPYGFVLAALSAVTMCLYLKSDSLVGFGSKKASGTDEERAKAQQEMVQEAAGILAKKPKEARQAIVEKTAEYLVRQPELRMTNCNPKKLAQDMLAAIDAMTPRHMRGGSAGTTVSL